MATGHGRTRTVSAPGQTVPPGVRWYRHRFCCGILGQDFILKIRMTTPQEMPLIKAVADLTMKVARPLLWYDVRASWPTYLPGATCFILRFNTGLIGVTADHVITAFEKAKRQAGETVSLLRTAHFDLSGAIIDRDAELDLATFSVTEGELIESEAVAADCRAEWPPPIPDEGKAITFAGYPECLRVGTWPHGREFRAFADVTWVQDVTDRYIVATFEPKRDIRVLAAPDIPELGANWSGCSGGPVLMHIERNGFHRWFPVGMIVEGRGKPRDGEMPDGEMQEFDRFLFRRLDFLNANGSIIKNPNAGWLPPGSGSH